MYMAREWDVWDRASLMLAVISDNLVPLNEIHAVNTFSSRKAQLAYQESALALQFLIVQYGRHGLQDVLQQLRMTGSLNQAMLSTFGISVVQFEQAWLDFLRRTYGWDALPADEFSVWLLIVMLVFFAYWAQRRQRQRILRRWEEEESSGDWRMTRDRNSSPYDNPDEEERFFAL
jgi:hypothetical protein